MWFPQLNQQWLPEKQQTVLKLYVSLDTFFADLSWDPLAVFYMYYTWCI